AQACLPHLLQADNPHILTLAPPPSLDPKWWAPHTGYTLAKMGMSFVTLGLAGEFGPQGVAASALWPRTLISPDALNMIPGGRGARDPGAACEGLRRQLPDRRRSAARGRHHRPVALRHRSGPATAAGPLPGLKPRRNALGRDRLCR